MREQPARRRRRWLVAVVVAALLTANVAGLFALVTDVRAHRGQGLRIAAGPALPSVGTVVPARPTPVRTDAGGPPYVTSVEPGGRYFLDQRGQPLLVRGDSPWSMLTDLSVDQASLYLRSRSAQGFNAAIVSLIGATANGAPHDDGSTFDGIAPFVGGDVTAWNPAYWERAHTVLRAAADAGITVFLYPIDGWTVGHAFVPSSQAQCRVFGSYVAGWAADLPNIVWMVGGDYFPQTDDLAAGSDVDHCMADMLDGIRSTGDGRPFSIQLGWHRSLSTENPFWRSRVDWNFVYTYYPTYEAVLAARATTPTIPTVLGEANYEGLNLVDPSPPTTDQTLRRQVLWALTSGAAGDFFGTADWLFQEGWETRLDSSGARQVSALRSLVAGLPWWRLQPDTANRLVTGGRGTPATSASTADVLEDDYVTAALTDDGTAALVYLPSGHAVTLDTSVLARGSTAQWVDPSTAQAVPATLASSMTPPGSNAEGDPDWLLVIRAPGS